MQNPFLWTSGQWGWLGSWRNWINVPNNFPLRPSRLWMFIMENHCGNLANLLCGRGHSGSDRMEVLSAYKEIKKNMPKLSGESVKLSNFTHQHKSFYIYTVFTPTRPRFTGRWHRPAEKSACRVRLKVHFCKKRRGLWSFLADIYAVTFVL